MYGFGFGYGQRRREGGGSDPEALLSAPLATVTGFSTAMLGVTTNESGGTLSWVVTTSAASPSAAQVKAGQDHTGAAAADSGSQAVAAAGVQAATATGLSPVTAYSAHFMHEDTVAQPSSVVTTAAFTTDALPLDAIAFYAVLSARRVLSAWTGAIYRIRRASDDVEMDVIPTATGWGDKDAIVTWLGGSTAHLVTIYDQTGNSRNWTQLTEANQPTLDLSTDYPVFDFDDAGPQWGNVANAGGVLRNVGFGTILTVQKVDAASGAVQIVAAVSTSGSGLSSRADIRFTTAGLLSATGRLTDAGSAESLTMAAEEVDLSWMTSFARFHWSQSDLRLRKDHTELLDSSFHTDGTTDDTDSTHVTIGSVRLGGLPIDGKISLVAFSRHLFTNIECINVEQALHGPRGAMPVFDTLKNAGYGWYNNSIARCFDETRTLLGVATQSGDPRVASLGDYRTPDLRSYSPDDHNQPAISEHLAAHAGHDDDAKVYIRRLPSDLTDLPGATVTEITFPDVVTYVQVFERANAALLVSRLNDTDWYVSTCEDVTANPPVFSTPRHLLDRVAGSGKLYIWGGYLSADVVRFFVYLNPSQLENDISYFDVNMDTGLVYAGATEFGYLDGSAAAGGATLPLGNNETPVAYAVGTGNSVRLLDVRQDAAAILFAEFTTGVSANAGTYYVKEFGEAPNEICDTGAFFGPNEWRPGGACFLNDGSDEIATSREESGTWSIERWSTAWDGDFSLETPDVVASSTRMLVMPLSPINAPAVATTDNPHLLWRTLISYTGITTWVGNVDWLPD